MNSIFFLNSSTFFENTNFSQNHEPFLKFWTFFKPVNFILYFYDFFQFSWSFLKFVKFQTQLNFPQFMMFFLNPWAFLKFDFFSSNLWSFLKSGNFFIFVNFFQIRELYFPNLWSFSKFTFFKYMIF